MEGDTIISINWLRKLITQECSYHVSEESLVELRDFIEEIVRKIVVEAVKEFEELNTRRKMQGLRELRRLNKYSVKRAIDNVFNGCINVDTGLRSCRDVSPGGKKCQKLPPKSAVEVQ